MTDFLMGLASYAIVHTLWRHLLYPLLVKTGHVCCRVVTGSTGHNVRVFINGREGDHVIAANIPGRAGKWGFLGWVDELEAFEDGSLATRQGEVIQRPRRYGFTKYEIVEESTQDDL